MSNETVDELARLHEELELFFLLLHDDRLAITNAYGVREAVPERANARRKNAWPSVFVIGRDRRIRYAHVATNPADRASVDDILAALRDF